ncbi:MAG: serine/threonine-protein kinase [Polyangiales bacterium]
MSEHDRDPRIGSVLQGQYRIEALIKRGGMGAVYRGVQLSMNRPVAIKLIGGLAAQVPESTRRFRREAEALAQLRHPNTVRIFELGVTDGGELFTVMELLEGHDLAQHLLQHGALPVDQALTVARDALAALSDAHALGIVHRDLKPANIFLSELHDGRLAAKLTDFGVAHIEQSAAATKLTLAGSVMGTPAYMSPEQADGRPAGPRSDLYSLGVTLFHMLAGRVPFDSDSVASVLVAHLTKPPPRLRELTPNLRGHEPVQRLLDQLLEKNPERRPASAQAAIALVDAILRELPSAPTQVLPPAAATTAAPQPPHRIGTQTSFGALPRTLMTVQGTVIGASRDKRSWIALSALLVLVGAFVSWPSQSAVTPGPAETQTQLDALREARIMPGPPLLLDGAERGKQGGAAGAAAAQPAPTDQQPVHWVRIITAPSRASVRLQGVELGQTPYDFQFRGDSRVQLSLAGYQERTLALTSATEPNVVVELTRVNTPQPKVMAAGGGSVTPTPTPAPKPAPTSPPSGPTRERLQQMPRSERQRTMLASGPPYLNVAQTKRAYRQGLFDEPFYDDIIWVLKKRRHERIATEKTRFRRGEITRDEYDRRVRQIDTEYEGSPP